ncbi:hypothetical protein Cgig2_009241 [Carnegiea gigantea]|uniref:Uncharacterized protein n=1 Tax=Carnegiea gigantea TaxID=171969 RepID=A0A9Q1JGB2_9CARY|nr:hypothetical protein Cgig2_009241 [Carnegiea gigantea]
MAAPSAADGDYDEWEFVNDDGFVYKRKKRRLDPTSLARPPDPVPDPATEGRERRRRKKKALLELKDRYQKEISLWENLSNTLKTMEENVKSRQDKHLCAEERENGWSQSSVLMQKRSGSWVTELLLQVEAQEEVLCEFSHLCDAAESLCNAQDEKTQRAFLDLPLWVSSPHELMASLSED